MDKEKIGKAQEENKGNGDEDRVIVRVNLSWILPPPFIRQLNQSMKFSNLPKELGYILEDVENAFIQVWESRESYIKTIEEKIKINERFTAELYDSPSFQLILRYLESQKIFPEPFPPRGLCLTYSIVRSNFANGIPQIARRYYHEIDSSIEIHEVEINTTYDVVFPTKVSFAKFLCVLNPDLVKPIIGHGDV